MNFRHDFAEIAKRELNCLGIFVPKDWDDYKIALKFFQVKQRRMNSDIPYVVVYSQELLHKLPELSSKDQAAVRHIEWCLKNRKPITCYMSREINTTSMKASDFMLKNWEIHHVHLEKIQPDKPALNQNLLFFQVKGQVVHFIDVKLHPTGSSWFDRDLLEIVYRNWPNLLIYKSGIKPSEIIPDDKIYELTKHIVTFISFHGGILFPTGLGVMSSGDSGKAVRTIQSIFNNFALWEKWLEENETSLKAEINRLHHPVPKKLDFSLMIEENHFIAYEEYAQIKKKMFAVSLLLQTTR